jgi:transcriptional regulator with XRE-family HTH domain
VDIHDRLKEERKRLSLNQTDFGKIAGVGKTTQINYESGERSPDAAYLAAIAAAGADAQYIVTGIRSEMALAPEERLMLDRYRASSKALRDAALRVLLGGG